MGLRSGLTAVAVVALFAPSPARAAGITKEQCADADQQAQDLRRDGKFSSARAKLQQCSDSICPGLVRDDCVQRLDDLDHAQPTIVFDAKDGDGHDLVAVHVTVDGQPLAEKLEGRALRVDPGAHSFTFTVAGTPPVTQSFVLKEGEKERRERIVIGATPKSTSPSPSPVAPASPATPAGPAPSGLTSAQWIGVGLAGAGVVGLGVGAAFGLMTGSAWSNAKSDCGGDTTHCLNVATANNDKNTANSDSTISAVGFAAGGALLVGGAVLFLTGGRHQEASAARLVVTPALSPGQAGAAIHGTF
ncbi:MAG: hypothetical protein ACRENE_33855 [Polyangiaceae bacterium]